MSYRVLMITSEAVPFAKAGGLADMTTALSGALKRCGADARILMPLYGFIDRAPLTQLTADWSLPFANRTETAGLWEGRLPEADIPVYFLDAPGYFDRPGLYGPSPAAAYPDNALRYSLLSRAALYLEEVLEWFPQIFHSHDWPAGLNPVYVRREAAGLEERGKRGTVFTIHNMGYQGVFSLRDSPWTGLTPREIEGFRFDREEGMNFLLGGIEQADRVTTVSPHYAREIRTPAFGHGLDGPLRRRGEALQGIVNGADYREWNPGADRYLLPDCYDAASPEGKSRVKQRLQREMGLEEDPSVPLFAMVSRLVDQKGIRELCGEEGILEEFCRTLPIQAVVLGTGEEWCQEELRRLGEQLPNLSVRIAYSEALSHLIEGGADFFMMPSRYEPCGLNQLYSLKYGTLPIVRRTGGLADTVIPSDGEGGGTGYLFREPTGKAFLEALKRACADWYERPALIAAMRRNAMAQDFSWEPSARAYLAVYREILG